MRHNANTEASLPAASVPGVVGVARTGTHRSFNGESTARMRDMWDFIWTITGESICSWLPKFSPDASEPGHIFN